MYTLTPLSAYLNRCCPRCGGTLLTLTTCLYDRVMVERHCVSCRYHTEMPAELAQDYLDDRQAQLAAGQQTMDLWRYGAVADEPSRVAYQRRLI